MIRWNIPNEIFNEIVNEMDVTILGDDWSKTFYWPDALPAAKPPMEMTHYQHACGQWGG